MLQVSMTAKPGLKIVCIVGYHYGTAQHGALGPVHQGRSCHNEGMNLHAPALTGACPADGLRQHAL